MQLNWDSAYQSNFVPERRYDTIVAADVVYNPGNARTMAACAMAHLKEGGRLLLVVPANRRGLAEAFNELRERGGVSVRVHAALAHRPAEDLDAHTGTSSSSPWIAAARTTSVHGMELVVVTKSCERGLPPPESTV